MFIKEVVLDGFKSYAKRTVISGFDPEFNAITGLNGSGKSNILDAVCFVLGISNLSQVRASSLQELVYKQGQAHVKKASVTLVFDNSDAAQSPVGYEGFDTITVTRQVRSLGASNGSWRAGRRLWRASGRHGKCLGMPPLEFAKQRSRRKGASSCARDWEIQHVDPQKPCLRALSRPAPERTVIRSSGNCGCPPHAEPLLTPLQACHAAAPHRQPALHQC